MLSRVTSFLSVILPDTFPTLFIGFLQFDWKLSKITTLFSIMLAGFSASFLINFLHLDWEKGRTRGFFAGLVFSSMMIYTTIFAVLFRTGIKFRPSGEDEMSADNIISGWPDNFIALPFFIAFFTISGWIMDILIDDKRRR
jgi:hypothetical protein